MQASKRTTAAIVSPAVTAAQVAAAPNSESYQTRGGSPRIAPEVTGQRYGLTETTKEGAANGGSVREWRYHRTLSLRTYVRRYGESENATFVMGAPREAADATPYLVSHTRVAPLTFQRPPSSALLSNTALFRTPLRRAARLLVWAEPPASSIAALKFGPVWLGVAALCTLAHPAVPSTESAAAAASTYFRMLVLSIEGPNS